ncbi:unnamed protein product [Eretmochelys imbricata]
MSELHTKRCGGHPGGLVALNLELDRYINKPPFHQLPVPATSRAKPDCRAFPMQPAQSQRRCRARRSESTFMLIQAICCSLQRHKSPAALLFQPSHASRTQEMEGSCIVLLGLLLVCSSHAGKQDALILGGRKVVNHSRPYMAILENDYKEILCDGFLIQPEWVMTAAHCRSARNFRVLIVLGVELLSDSSNHVWDIAQFRPHPHYNPTTWENDIMLVQLNNPVPYNKEVQPVKLPQQDREIPSTAACSTAGWGHTRDGGKRSTNLREVNVTLVPRDSCASVHKRKITRNMICAGNKEHNACQGDSGGPLVCDGVAEGVVSFGSKECGKTPTVYTKISRYLPWMNKVIKSAR